MGLLLSYACGKKIAYLDKRKYLTNYQVVLGLLKVHHDNSELISNSVERIPECASMKEQQILVQRLLVDHH